MVNKNKSPKLVGHGLSSGIGCFAEQAIPSNQVKATNAASVCCATIHAEKAQIMSSHYIRHSNQSNSAAAQLSISTRGKQHTPLTENDIQEIERLLCGTGYRAWIRHIAQNPGIKTHELPQRSKGANNPADISRKMNQRLIPHGWQIVKQVITKPTESWGWWIVRVIPNGDHNE